MNMHPDPDVMESIPVRRDLQRGPLKADTVIRGNGPLVLLEIGIECRVIYLSQITLVQQSIQSVLFVTIYVSRNVLLHTLTIRAASS